MMTVAKIVVCSIFIIVCLLAGCSNQEGEEVSFVATVLENNQDSLLVEPAEGSVELSSADRIVAHVSDATITDAKGSKVDITAVEVGSQIKIHYDGSIAESYPAQIFSIPALSGRPIRKHPATDSGNIRPVVLETLGQPFRKYPAT